MGERLTSSSLSRGSRQLAVLGLVLAMIASGLGAGASVLGGPGSQLPVLVDETVDGGAALSLTVELSGPALYRIDLIGEGPRNGTPVSMGFVAYDANRSYEGLTAITTFASQERQRTVLAGEQMPAPAYGTPDHGDPIAALLPSVDEPDRSCPLACASRLEQPDRTEAGVNHHGIWLGGVDETRLQVIGDDNVTDVQIRAGTPIVAGAEDFEQGTANVQHQPTTTIAGDTAFAGAKAIHEASHEATVDHKLVGVVGLAEFKTVCAGSCVSSETARAGCGLLPATDCRAAQIAWTGPNGSGETSHHVFDGSPAGDYVFHLEGMVDAYASPTPVVADYAYLDPGEHHPYLSAADLPTPPTTAETR